MSPFPVIEAARKLSNLYSSWKWPEISGLHDFGGKLLHSADWDNTYNFENKKVVVIGAGSSAIQIVPQLQPSKY